MNQFKMHAFVFLVILCGFIAAESWSAERMVLAEKEAAGPQEKVATPDALIKERYPNAIRTESGLMYIVLKEGAGETPKRGALVEAHYTGKLLDGKKFDSSVDRGQPFHFTVGRGRVIRGWDEAFLTMKKGEKRILIVPPNLAYGAAGMGSMIPPNAVLIFEVELLDFL